MPMCTHGQYIYSGKHIAKKVPDTDHVYVVIVQWWNALQGANKTCTVELYMNNTYMCTCTCRVCTCTNKPRSRRD